MIILTEGEVGGLRWEETTCSLLVEDVLHVLLQLAVF
jgi:hypothetical protein